MENASLSPKELWRMAVEQLRPQVDSATYNSWLIDPVGQSLVNGILTVLVRSRFVGSVLENRFGYHLGKTLSEIAGICVETRFVTEEQYSGLSQVLEGRQGDTQSEDRQEPLLSSSDVQTATNESVREMVVDPLEKDLVYESDEVLFPQQLFLSPRYAGPLRTKRFDTFQDDVPGVQDAVTTALNFVFAMKGTLFIVGPPACGKTHLAAACAWEYQEQKLCERIFFAETKELFTLLEDSFGTPRYDTLLFAIRNIEMLVLDNLKHHVRKDQETTWSDDTLYKILVQRFELEKVTIITTRPENLLNLSSGLLSRLGDGRVHTAIIRNTF